VQNNLEEINNPKSLLNIVKDDNILTKKIFMNIKINIINIKKKGENKLNNNKYIWMIWHLLLL